MTHELPTHSTIDISLIKIDRAARQRREIETIDLQESISKLGLLQAPVVRRQDYKLMAGERRLEACKALGWQRITVRWFEGLDELEAELVELAENIKRKALSWQDEARAIARIYELSKAKQPDLTTREFAPQVGVSQATVIRTLNTVPHLGEERIAKASSSAEAYNILARRTQRAQGEALEELLGISQEELPKTSIELSSNDVMYPSVNQSDAPPALHVQLPTDFIVQPAAVQVVAPPSPIQCANFFDWLLGPMPSQKFTFIHCDFPYGIDLFAGQQGRGSEPTQGYDDQEELYFRLLEAFCKNLDKFFALSGHLMFWFSGKHRQRTMNYFAELAPSLVFHSYDLIWHKSDNAGIAGDYRRHPRHTYEQALLATRGGRHILQVAADSYSAPTQKQLHPSCKPEPMLRHFFQMFVDQESRVLDPSCGAGSSLRAAASLGAKQLLGLELDQEMAKVAQREFRLRRG